MKTLLFGNIFSLLRLSSKSASDVAGFVEGFTARLAALERTQRVLMTREGDTVGLRGVVEAELHAYGADGSGNVTEGPEIGTGNRTAQALGMVVHELRLEILMRTFDGAR